MRHPKLLSILISFLAILVLSVPGLAGRSVAQASPAEQIEASSPCRTYGKVSTQPNTMLFGEYFTTTIRVDAACADYGDALHIVLVLDASGSMAGGPTNAMKKAARQFINRLALKGKPDTRVGVVQFNESALVLCQLTRDSGRASSCVGRVGASGGTAIDMGIFEGHDVMRKGRSLVPAGPINEIMIVLTDGANNDGCLRIEQQATLAKNAGIQIYSICVGSGCDPVCMRLVASGTSFFYTLNNASVLSLVFERIRESIITTRFKKLEVFADVPANMEIVISSISGNGRWEERDRIIYWEEEFVATSGMTLTYRQRALESGFQPVSSAIWADSTDLWGRQRREDFSVPKVLILGGAK